MDFSGPKSTHYYPFLCTTLSSSHMASPDHPDDLPPPCITFTVGTLWSYAHYMFSIPTMFRPQEEDDVYLHILRSKWTRDRIMRLAKKLHNAPKPGPVFISHPLLVQLLILWSRDRMASFRRQVRGRIQGAIFL